MNQTAKDLGLNATYYYNCHGAQPNYITARSQAKLTRRFIDDYPDILRITSKSGFNFNGSYYNNTNHLLNTMAPYEGLDGFKTGTIAGGRLLRHHDRGTGWAACDRGSYETTSDAQRLADSRQPDYGFAEIKSGMRPANDQCAALPQLRTASVRTSRLPSPHGWKASPPPTPARRSGMSTARRSMAMGTAAS